MGEAELLQYVKDPGIFGLLIVRPFGLILNMLYSFVQNYGLTVILFALIVKIVLIPLAIKSKKSTLAMTAMNAEMQQLQKKYANNREKLNIEMQKLYEKHGVSPMSGCLTQFIQLPIMMGLYYAVQQPLQYILGLSAQSVAKLAQFVGIEKASNFMQIQIAQKLTDMFQNGGFPSEITSIGQDVAQNLIPLDFSFFSLDLSQTPSFKDPSILWLIPILSGLTAFLSSFVMQKMQKIRNGTNNKPVAEDATQKQMRTLTYIMPLMSVYFGFILPGTIGIYWIFNNIFTMVQELILGSIFNKKKAQELEIAELKIEEEKEAKKAAKKAKYSQKKGDK